jgi:hypothetical protein
MEQEDLELEVSLGYVVRPCLKKKKKITSKKEREEKGKEERERVGRRKMSTGDSHM